MPSNTFLDKAWLDNHLRKVRNRAGNRYTPKLNVDLPISDIFNGLSRTTEWTATCQHIHGTRAVQSVWRFRYLDSDRLRGGGRFRLSVSLKTPARKHRSPLQLYEVQKTFKQGGAAALVAQRRSLENRIQVPKAIKQPFSEFRHFSDISAPLSCTVLQIEQRAPSSGV